MHKLEPMSARGIKLFRVLCLVAGPTAVGLLVAALLVTFREVPAAVAWVSGACTMLLLWALLDRETAMGLPWSALTPAEADELANLANEYPPVQAMVACIGYQGRAYVVEDLERARRFVRGSATASAAHRRLASCARMGHGLRSAAANEAVAAPEAP